jgi:hypothetical protein
MMTPQTVLGYVKAEPFRPFRILMARGKTLDVRHPEMIKVLKSYAIVFKADGDGSNLSDEWQSVSLRLAESISHLETPVSP